MKKRIWRFYILILWKIQDKLTTYSINKWHDKGLFSKYGFLLTDLKDDRD